MRTVMMAICATVPRPAPMVIAPLESQSIATTQIFAPRIRVIRAPVPAPIRRLLATTAMSAPLIPAFRALVAIITPWPAA